MVNLPLMCRQLPRKAWLSRHWASKVSLIHHTARYSQHANAGSSQGSENIRNIGIIAHVDAVSFVLAAMKRADSNARQRAKPPQQSACSSIVVSLKE